MLAELRRLQNILCEQEYQRQGQNYQRSISNSQRSIKEVINILDMFGLFVDKNQKITIISKDNGDFFVNLIEGSVKFTPVICLKCKNLNRCKYSQRKVCIVENSEGWANYQFSKIDMLILAKIFAILFNLLPNHVSNQIKSLSDCFDKKPKIKTLENNVIQEIKRALSIDRTANLSFPHAPPIQGPIPPPRLDKPHLRFTPPPNQLKNQLNYPNMIKLRSSILKELRRLHHLIELSKKFGNSPNVF